MKRSFFRLAHHLMCVHILPHSTLLSPKGIPVSLWCSSKENLFLEDLVLHFHKSAHVTPWTHIWGLLLGRLWLLWPLSFIIPLVLSPVTYIPVSDTHALVDALFQSVYSQCMVTNSSKQSVSGQDCHSAIPPLKGVEIHLPLHRPRCVTLRLDSRHLARW